MGNPAENDGALRLAEENGHKKTVKLLRSYIDKAPYNEDSSAGLIRARMAG